MTAPRPTVPLATFLFLLSGHTVSGQDAKAPPVAQAEVKIFGLRNADAAEAVKTLRELFPQGEKSGLRIALHRTTNTVLVRGAAEDLEAIAGILVRLDREPAEPPAKLRLTVLPLRDADAGDAVKTLQELFQGTDGKTFRIALNQNTNSLVVKGNAEDLETVGSVLRQLDLLAGDMKKKANGKR